MSDKLVTKFRTKPLSYFLSLHRKNRLNLSPGFQRKSVWSEKDRRKLIESIFRGFPVPSVFLYRRKDKRGRDVYDVLDGKQRLEAVFAYCRAKGFKKQGFDVRHQFAGVPSADEEAYDWNWRGLRVWRRQPIVLNYKIQVVEVTGELSDIQRLFVRINSTGKKLSNQERRRADYITSPILAIAERLSNKLAKRLAADRIVSPAQRLRMKDVELFCELIISFFQGPINKKRAVDDAMSGASTNLHTVRKAAREVVREYRLIRRLLPDLRATRFKNHSEFYSLMMALHELQHQNLDLSDARGLRIGERLLQRLSEDANRAQEERRSLHKRISIKPIVRDYLMAVEQGADALGQRKKRQSILTGLLENLFSGLDRQRSFTRQQRELVWSAASSRRCPGFRNGKRCKTILNWNNFQVDHIRPWSRGGKTDLKNAGVLCKSCNTSKGNRSKLKKAR